MYIMKYVRICARLQDFGQIRWALIKIKTKASYSSPTLICVKRIILNIIVKLIELPLFQESSNKCSI